MTRTLMIIDGELHEAVDRRQETRTKLANRRIPRAERDMLAVQDGMFCDRIETLLEERSLVMFARQITSL